MSVSENPDAITHPVEFTGKGGEFFGIWIVNLLLSIVTLGIYGAWAKVRTNQYFYGHTKINGHGFRYLASPLQILKGRVIAVLALVLYNFLSILSLPLALILFIAFVFLSPWIIIQGLKFNMRMTSYRNVRLSFSGRYGEALINFVLLPLLSALTLFIAFPWVLKRIHAFIYNNIQFGGKAMSLENSTKEYYITSLIALGACVVLYILIFVIISAFGLSLNDLMLSGADVMSDVFVTVTILMMLVYWFGFTIIGAIFQSRIRNHILNSAVIEDVATFESNMRAGSFSALMLTNTLIILCTFGLAYPFAKIRKAAYIAQVTEVNVEPRAAEVIDNIVEGANALGDEAAGFFDLDFSLT